MPDDAIESEVRQWLRDHQGHAHCDRCIAGDLQQEPELIRAAMDVLATSQVFSAGPCGCGKWGLSYGLAGWTQEIEPEGAATRGRPLPFGRMPGSTRCVESYPRGAAGGGGA
jgi:hypothetical protein